mgnify:CR=1 FL=1
MCTQLASGLSVALDTSFAAHTAEPCVDVQEAPIHSSGSEPSGPTVACHSHRSDGVGTREDLASPREDSAVAPDQGGAG